jgi:hypothetical protein
MSEFIADVFGEQLRRLLGGTARGIQCQIRAGGGLVRSRHSGELQNLASTGLAKQAPLAPGEARQITFETGPTTSSSGTFTDGLASAEIGQVDRSSRQRPEARKIVR